MKKFKVIIKKENKDKVYFCKCKVDAENMVDILKRVFNDRFNFVIEEV